MQNVLVVDDNYDNVEVLTLSLELEGHHVHGATSSIEAIQLFQNNPIDFVFSDLILPDHSGFELARAFRNTPRDNYVRLCALSGMNNPEFLQEAFDAGFDHYVLKPVDMDTVHMLVQTDDGLFQDYRKIKLQLGGMAEHTQRMALARDLGKIRARIQMKYWLGSPNVDLLACKWQAP